MDFWPTIITTTLATGSAILASHLTNKANLERLRLQFELENRKESSKNEVEMREQIYNAVYVWTGTTISRHVAFVSLLKGQSTWDQYLEFTGNVKGDQDLQTGIIEFRVKTHFPALRPHWDVLIESFRAMAELYIHYAVAKNGNIEQKLDLLAPAQKAVSEFIKATDNFKKQIIDCTPAA